MTVTIYRHKNFLYTMGIYTYYFICLNNGMFIAKYFAHPVGIYVYVHLPSVCPQRGGVVSFCDHKTGEVGGFLVGLRRRLIYALPV